MALDWDALVLAPVMAVFGEGDPVDDTMLPFYTPRGLPGFPLRDAVFDEQYEQVQVVDGEEPPSIARRPLLGVRTSLFPRDPAQNDRVRLPSTGKSYIVSSVQPDGHGHAKLFLMEAK